MQDPRKEITKIIQTLWTTRDASELETLVNKYFAPDAKFLHPLCKANTRNEILGLFQWCRLTSPEKNVDVSGVMYDSDSNVLVLEVREKLNIWFNPLPSKEGRMVVRIQLRKVGASHVISVEEDLIHPTDQAGFLGTPLVPFVALCLRLGCLLSNLGACVLASVGSNTGLRGCTVNYTGLAEVVGLARANGGKANGNALKD